MHGHEDWIYRAAFSRDGRRVVMASADKTARVWDATTGTQLALMAGHQGFVFAAMFSPDGQRVVTASSDKTARVWDPETGKQLTRWMATHKCYAMRCFPAMANAW